MPRDAATLEAAIERVETVLEHARTHCAGCGRNESALNDVDNDLGAAVEAWAEAEAEKMVEEARRLLRPLFARAAALVHTGADGERLGELLDLADALDVEPKLDAEGDAAKLAERVRALRARLDQELGFV